jgi:proline iminopeptidase
LDIELLRHHLNIDRWLVIGGSWGSTLALAYTEAYPDRVTEMVLFGITTGRYCEFDWLFRDGVAIFFQSSLRSVVPVAEQNGDLVEVYCRLLNNADPKVRQQAVDAWCMWESATPQWPPTNRLDERFTNFNFTMAFNVSHNAWLEDEILLRNADKLANIPGIARANASVSRELIRATDKFGSLRSH